MVFVAWGPCVGGLGCVRFSKNGYFSADSIER